MYKHEAAKRPRFFIFDGSLFVFVLLLLLYPSWITFWAIIAAALVITLLERRGMKITMLGRWARRFLIGNERVVRPWWRKRLLRD